MKFKRCCGSTREDARALEERLEIEMELEALPALMPDLRPRDAGFAAWAATVDESPDELWNGVLDAGAAAIDPAERKRIVAAAGRPWHVYAQELGDDERAETLLLRGAVAAGLRERQRPGPEFLELLDRVPEAVVEPIALFALLVNPFDVWGLDQLVQVGDVGSRALAEEGVDVLWDDAVRDRLLQQVDRLAAHVPLGRGAGVDAALLEGCQILRGEEAARLEVAALLLARAGAFAGVY